ncbi:MAG: DMT family transporter [Gammaproteobacteria bacterium]|nr:DMT family transporter [Gammaproteobacteria bacterium]
MLSAHAKGLLITASGVLIISPDGLLTRLIETDHWTMIFWRSLLLSFGMWLVISLRNPNRVWQQYKTVRGPGLLMVAAFSLGTISFVFSITHTSVANTLIILSSTPLFAALISRVILHERIQPRTMIAILLVAVGITVIASGSAGGDAGATNGLIGDLVAIVGSFSLACGFTFVRRFPRISSSSAISCSGILTALLILPLASPLAISQADLGYLLIMGLYVVPIGTALMFIGPRYIPAAEVGLLVLLESILGPVWVWLVLAEQPGVNTLAGGAIILSTLAINTVWSLRHPLPKVVSTA